MVRFWRRLALVAISHRSSWGCSESWRKVGKPSHSTMVFLGKFGSGKPAGREESHAGRAEEKGKVRLERSQSIRARGRDEGESRHRRVTFVERTLRGGDRRRLADEVVQAVDEGPYLLLKTQRAVGIVAGDAFERVLQRDRGHEQPECVREMQPRRGLRFERRPQLRPRPLLAFGLCQRSLERVTARAGGTRLGGGAGLGLVLF